ncbi:hypothetical protein C4O30_00350 [Lactiplantibacillus plantarum]|uniref:hypothetical protein n=1 Tax=Lactiplantibacillus plantarum TaxID=1590 RepID=UPI000CE9A13B|nr:hypothetical protein [Lactiplantibacillus plantarum]AVE81474.1 hypothetical protein C4O30_00010 [Lactiplantibacillus plantarum]AVE81531.1 hypothetical protein C4O30_00350 [Lactiplantibacillus plantarum]
MPLFGKSEAKKNLIETIGAVPEGYHSTGIIQTFASGQNEPHVQAKLLKDLENICVATEAAGFCNYRLTSQFDTVNSQNVIFAYADMIKPN